MVSLPLALRAAAAALALAATASAMCPITKKTIIAVYADEDGGVGSHSAMWTKSFFSWWTPGGAGAADAVAYVEHASDLADCRALASYDNLLLWVQPGGSADNQSLALGTSGRDNILDFAASSHGHIYATCAGFYYAAGTYWWYGEFVGAAYMPHWWPTVEGPITAIAAYPDFAPATLSNGLTAIYYGGPGMGIANTTAALPSGAEVLAYYDMPGVPAATPAVILYRGPYVQALFASPHPEATADDLTCAPPAPPGCITSAQQLANWQFMAKSLNTLMGTSFAVPTSLGFGADPTSL